MPKAYLAYTHSKCVQHTQRRWLTVNGSNLRHNTCCWDVQSQCHGVQVLGKRHDTASTSYSAVQHDFVQQRKVAASMHTAQFQALCTAVQATRQTA